MPLKIFRPLVFMLLLQVPFTLYAQEFTQNIRAKLSIYAEVGGNSDTYALNIDRIMYQREYWKVGARVGLGTNLFFLKEEVGVYPVVPLEVFGMYGKSRNHFEFGMGYTRRFTEAPELMQSMYFGRLGFRYQVPKGGLVVRFAATPFVSPESKDEDTGNMAIIPRFGLSVGRSW
jgi:hypothetical protein